MLTVDRFDIGQKSNTFGNISPEDKENSLKHMHMRSGSFGGFDAPSIHSQSALLPNEKDYGFIEEEINRFNYDLADKEPISSLIQIMTGSDKN